MKSSITLTQPLISRLSQTPRIQCVLPHTATKWLNNALSSLLCCATGRQLSRTAHAHMHAACGWSVCACMHATLRLLNNLECLKALLRHKNKSPLLEARGKKFGSPKCRAGLQSSLGVQEAHITPLLSVEGSGTEATSLSALT